MAFPIKIGPQRRTVMDLDGETSGREAPTRSEAQSGSETCPPPPHSWLRDLPDATLAAPPHSGKGHLHARELREDGGADVATQTVIGLIEGPRLFNIAWEKAPQYISWREAVFFTRKKRKLVEHDPTHHRDPRTIDREALTRDPRTT